MSTMRWCMLLTITSLAIVAGAATGTAAASAGCAATTNSSTTFSAWGDTSSYVVAPGGNTTLADGGSLLTACTRAPGIQSVVRFFARSVSGGGAIHVELLVNGGKQVLDGGTVTAGDTLAPVDQVVVPWDRNDRRAADLQVRLTAVGGSFEIGDIYLDPFVMKAASVG